MSQLVGLGGASCRFAGSQDWGLVRLLKSKDGGMGRVARLGVAIGSGGIGGEGSDGAAS